MKFICDHAFDECYCEGCVWSVPNETELEHNEVQCKVEPDYTVTLVPYEYMIEVEDHV